MQLTRYSDLQRAGRPWSRSSSPGRVKNFLFTKSIQVLKPIQCPIQWVIGALSPFVKRSRRESDYSHPTSAQVLLNSECWGPEFDSRRYQIFCVVGLKRGPLSLMG
jgi:hypothetical protein